MKKFSLLAIGLIILAAISGLFYYQFIMRPVNSTDSSPVEIVIPKGQSLSKTAQSLYAAGLLRSPLSLRVLAYTQSATVQAGRFKLSKNMTPAQIIEALNTGKLDYWVTFLEGWRREQFADALAKAATDNNLKFDRQQFLDLTQDKEGYLFPDSYLFPLDASTEMIVSTLEKTLDKKIPASLPRPKHQILTMASLVEREARTDSARKIVAGILWKRLDNNWPLQVDATLQYIKGFDKSTNDWWAEPLAADKDLNSPYNTYQHPGLPPGPICAPSESSILAAAYPEPSEYWFYLTDNQGKMHYAKDLAEHSANVNTYLR